MRCDAIFRFIHSFIHSCFLPSYYPSIHPSLSNMPQSHPLKILPPNQSPLPQIPSSPLSEKLAPCSAMHDKCRVDEGYAGGEHCVPHRGRAAPRIRTDMLAGAYKMYITEERERLRWLDGHVSYILGYVCICVFMYVCKVWRSGADAGLES
jgi:hypothetical protein